MQQQTADESISGIISCLYCSAVSALKLRSLFGSRRRCSNSGVWPCCRSVVTSKCREKRSQRTWAYKLGTAAIAWSYASLQWNRKYYASRNLLANSDHRQLCLLLFLKVRPVCASILSTYRMSSNADPAEKFQVFIHNSNSVNYIIIKKIAVYKKLCFNQLKALVYETVCKHNMNVNRILSSQHTARHAYAHQLQSK